MMVLFEIRAKLTGIYQKYDFIIKTVLKFALVLITLMEIRSRFAYNDTLSKSVIVLVLSLFSAFLPSSLMVLVVIAYMVLQILGLSALMAITVCLLCLILYCFFLRFTPKYGAAVVAVPVLRTLGFPYVMPLSMGLFGNLLTIVPTSCGVFAYYMLAIIKDNLITLQQVQDSDNPLAMYMDVINSLLKNPAMYVTMFIYAVVILVVYFIRRLNMDYSFEISIGVGTGVMIVGHIIGALKYDMGVGIFSVIICSLISSVLVLLFMFCYRALSYSAAEHVQFEDDDYYYYVKAVPKLRVNSPKKPVKKVVTRNVRRSEEEEELEDEIFETMDSKFLESTTGDEIEDNVKDELPLAAATAPKPVVTPIAKPIAKPIEKSIVKPIAKPVAAPAAKQVTEDDLFDDEDDDYK